MTDRPSSAMGFTEGSDEPGGIAEPRCASCGVRQSEPCPAEEPACRFDMRVTGNPRPEDIVERLRAAGRIFYEHRETECILYHDATDEIERLRAELASRPTEADIADMSVRFRAVNVAEAFERAGISIDVLQSWQDRAVKAEAELTKAKAATAAAIKAERERWQPIETAPKDGTTIIGGKPFFDPFICHWRDAKGGQWFSDVAHGFWHEDVTHWMPLPEPPAAIRGGDTP